MSIVEEKKTLESLIAELIEFEYYTNNHLNQNAELIYRHGLDGYLEDLCADIKFKRLELEEELAQLDNDVIVS